MKGGADPDSGSAVNHDEFKKMADAFIEAGFNYFDTAHGYVTGKSETTFGECVAARYPRDRFLIADKLTEPYFNSEGDIHPFFKKQLGWCRVDISISTSCMPRIWRITGNSSVAMHMRLR